MTSKTDASEAYVWIWLPGETEPVVAGRLTLDGHRLFFTYGASYRERKHDSDLRARAPASARYSRPEAGSVHAKLHLGRIA